MRPRIRFVILVLLILAAPFAHTAADKVQDFTLPSATDGSLVRLSDYPGQVVLINWWRSDCGWSQRESPKLVALYNKYRDRGFTILGISDDTAPTVGQVPSYLKRHGITWPIGLNDQGEFMREIRPKGRGETPSNYLVSRSGELTFLGLYRGEADWGKVEEAVARAVEAPPAAVHVAPRALEPAPPFTLATLQGAAVKLSDFAGKPLVVNFFTAGACDWAGAVLAKLHNDYTARGLQVVGIDLYDDDGAIQGCVARHGVTYPVLKGNQATQQAWIGSNAGWGTFFITRDGKVLKRIGDSIDNGLEATVFPKYAEYLLAQR